MRLYRPTETHPYSIGEGRSHDKAEVRDFVGSGIPTVDIRRRSLAAVAFVVTFDCGGSPQRGYLV